MKTEGDLARGHWKQLSVSYEEALARLPEALKAQGFGIITQVDIRETFKAKLGVVDPMQTLGAGGEGGGLADLAREVGARLEHVLADLPSSRGPSVVSRRVQRTQRAGQ